MCANRTGERRPWTAWPKDELNIEVQARMRYLYGRTDGSMDFPNSAEGDLLKMVHVLLTPNAEKTEVIG